MAMSDPLRALAADLRHAAEEAPGLSDVVVAGATRRAEEAGADAAAVSEGVTQVLLEGGVALVIRE